MNQVGECGASDNFPDLLHGAEKKVWGDAGYQGQAEAIHTAAPKAQDMTLRRKKRKDSVDEVGRRKNRTKARVRSKVEWPFRILKRVFALQADMYCDIAIRSRAKED